MLAILGEPAVAQSDQWARRFKVHNEKLNSGDPIQIAELVRNLAVARARKRLSPAETKLLAAARASFDGELATTWGIGPAAATARIDKALAANPDVASTRS